MRSLLTARLRPVLRVATRRDRKIKAHQTVLKAQVKTMATSSILGGSRLSEEVSGKDLQALGPSDNSDSGSDVMGAYGEEQLSSDSDSSGTGERADVGFDSTPAGADILPDHIETEAGVSAGETLDEVRQNMLELEDVENIVDESQDPESSGNLDEDE